MENHSDVALKGVILMKTKNRAEDEVQEKVAQGKNLTIFGTVTAIVGIVIYCGDSFSAGLEQQDSPMMMTGLGIIGLGTLLWLVGVVKYLKTVIDNDIPDSSF